MILGVLAVGGARHFDGLLTLLRCLPEFVGDDPKIWYFLDDPFLLWIEPRYALAGIGILHEALSIPDDPADIHLVVENASAALGIAVYCAEAPSPSAGGCHALAIEVQRDPLCRLSGGVATKNPPDDLSFDLVDDASTTHRFAARGQLHDDVITIAVASSRLAVFDATAQPASRLVGQIFEEERIHRALEANMQLRDLALGKGRNLDAGEAKPLIEAGNVLLISAQPIQRLGQDELKSPCKCIPDQRLDARPQNECRTADRLVGVLLDDQPALFLGMTKANAELIGDGRDSLVVGRIAGVDRDLHLIASTVIKLEANLPPSLASAPPAAAHTSAAPPVSPGFGPAPQDADPVHRRNATRGSIRSPETE